MPESSFIENPNPEIQTTRLIIEKTAKDFALNVSRGAIFAISPLNLNRDGQGTLDYYRINNLSRTKGFEVLMKDGSEQKTVNLPPDMLNRIAEYIRIKHEVKDKFDCSSFVHYANGIPYEYSKFKAKNWLVSLLNESELEPGSTVIISKTKDVDNYQPTHLAIYLGDNVYLSKFGSSGNLIATDLGEMKKGFGGKYAFKATPAPKATTLLRKS